ncbi:MAG: cysteine--tRNA ligase [Candidatus Omnitrophica bacterium]|nr:cysteine--tRNA ligase [Candidatus Omnitrophota bacterium]
MDIYNSLTRTKEEFVPLKAGEIGMYVCGPTVYDEPHIGHARSAYIFDVIRRYLEYKGYRVRFVRNVTDVDDKIIKKAQDGTRGQGSGAGLEEAVKEVAEKYLDLYHKYLEELGVKPPTDEPKATEYIAKMQAFIKLLIERGAAYQAGSDVYFDIKRASDYGKLSNQSLAMMEAGARIAPGENKRDPLDFALWKAAKEGEPSWDSPWGKGRPGWHIECSVMSSCLLGDEFDIHGGGIDLIFPHHENEVAQSEGAGKKFARYWMHNGLLTINGQKMAKSLGNFITIEDFIARHSDPDYLKLFFLSAHYRSPIDYTEERIAEAKKEKERFWILLDKIKRAGARGPRGRAGKEFEHFKGKFEEAMDDDFNTPLALAALFDLVTYANKYIGDRAELNDDERAELAEIGALLERSSGVFGLSLSKIVQRGELDVGGIAKLIEERNAARRAKDFKKADEIRKKLSDMSVILEDTKDGTEWRVKV